MIKQEHEIVKQIYMAQDSPQAADELVRRYLPFIRAETARFLHRPPVDGHDDELNIAMFAFYEAIMAYRQGRGAFLKLAAAGIRNRLIDYVRREKRHSSLISLDQPAGGDDDERTLLDQLDAGSNDIQKYLDTAAASSEINKFSADLQLFGLSLSDVADCCPRQERTLSACLRVLDYARRHPELLSQMVQSRKLPLAQLASGSGVERKTLERHRKYLIAILLAYTNGFEIIRSHLRQMNQKGGRNA